ncbi:L,D-transpeptidase family protein [Sphingomonas lutea]|uniref:L,D-transpeptidase family protein n=1 Tax=Sphingomonas lutea TaxID=1045317 RepID=A0A7G9SJ22_9SPHN|nr:L,D-transpeptidase family protein [Sphingomonas lutea]QNN67847.1 L,D-transpeptidase family protein [Sphingomonas lutea]
MAATSLSAQMPTAPVAVQPAPVAPAVEPPAPPPLPPAVWNMHNAQDLLYAIREVGSEGLEPADYDPAGLEAAMASGDPLRLSAEATARFNRLSNDLALGHVHKSARIQWFVVDKDLDAAKQDALLRNALSTLTVRKALDSLLPTHPQYAALKTALAATPEGQTAKLNRIKLNMDRWRWLPRDLGNKYIIVNVPGFHATLVENGVNRWKQRAIAGATKTPTPQLSVNAVGVMLNPSWEVPPSIAKEVAGKKGYNAVKDPKTGKFLRWSQPPGPANALGQMKFVMYNPLNIYLHDTNARSRFAGRMRALSHGCIRTENIHDLAMELLADDGGEWTPEKVKAQLATGKSKQANFVKPVPVYIVYFSAAGLNDGRIVDYADLYGRDGKALAALNTKDGGLKMFAPKPKTQVAGAKATKVASN